MLVDEAMGNAGGDKVDIWEQMRRRYLAPEWAIFFEVANGPGSHLRRYADAVAMSLFPSRGLDVHGFEIKCSRNDWVRELKRPEKADEIATYCDFWWLVVAEKEIVKDGELPEPWGLLTSNGKELRVAKRATRLDPKPLTRKFMAAMLRRAHENATNAVRKSKEAEEAYARGVADGKSEREWEATRNAERLAELRERIEAFQAVSGVRIDGYEGADDIGEAVKFVLHMRHRDGGKELEAAAEALERSAKQLRETAGAIRPVQAKDAIPEATEARKA